MTTLNYASYAKYSGRLQILQRWHNHNADLKGTWCIPTVFRLRISSDRRRGSEYIPSTSQTCSVMTSPNKVVRTGGSAIQPFHKLCRCMIADHSRPCLAAALCPPMHVEDAKITSAGSLAETSITRQSGKLLHSTAWTHSSLSLKTPTWTSDEGMDRRESL